jgi:serine protease Do
MRLIGRIAILAALGALALAAASTAQDWHAAPDHDPVRLTSGFTPDPYTVNVVSGGNDDASKLGSPCVGFVASAPDVDLYYTSGRYPQLSIVTVAAKAGDDPTIVIHAPDGRWYCNDDVAPNDVNAGITFTNPMSGLYDIWVGSYHQGQNFNTTLAITERTN